MDFDQILYASIKACRLGRQVLLSYFGELKKIEEKFHAGLVSEADKESERVIKGYLLEKFPGTFFLGEETYFENKEDKDTQQGKWICDPLDGTTNYVHQFPVFCISLAFEWQNQVQVGVIDVPILNETYTAIRGKGAHVNGKPLHINKNTDFSKSLLATGFFPDDKIELAEQLKFFGSIVGDCRGVRRAGAAAYDLCQVARGVFDGFWEKNLSPWDVAAGQVIVEEAGGIVRNYQNEVHNPYSRSLVAGNSAIVSEILRRFSQDPSK